ncbi:CBO0543 family protein [Anaerobacillus sp. MEB173]|uniref:CBO0543 family protein n=1 Tax=Anaerobacillus sp. MEB173 TaxID=3383345 RepID=UPI003F91729B
MHDPKKIEQLYKQISEINDEKLSIWVEVVLYTWQWWIGVILTVLPWIAWILYRRKDCTFRFLTVGFFIMFISTLLDAIGVQLGYWYYKHAVLPFIPAFAPWDTTLLPVVIMTLLQIKPTVSPYVKGLIFAGLTAYVGEPFFNWIDLYEPTVWKHIYSFPIYFILYLISHCIYNAESFHK